MKKVLSEDKYRGWNVWLEEGFCAVYARFHYTLQYPNPNWGKVVSYIESVDIGEEEYRRLYDGEDPAIVLASWEETKERIKREIYSFFTLQK